MKPTYLGKGLWEKNGVQRVEEQTSGDFGIDVVPLDHPQTLWYLQKPQDGKMLADVGKHDDVQLNFQETLYNSRIQ